jgi:hypothetical protein
LLLPVSLLGRPLSKAGNSSTCHFEKWLFPPSIQISCDSLWHKRAGIFRSTIGTPCVLPPYRHIILQRVFLSKGCF